MKSFANPSFAHDQSFFIYNISMHHSENFVKQRPQDKTRHHCRPCALWRLVAIAALGTLLAVVQLTNYRHHFHSHIAKHQILRNLQKQPALRLTFKLKRKAMYVHGASMFDLVATPAPTGLTDDNRMVYNGLASIEIDGHVHEYSLVNETTYYTHRLTNQPASEAESLCLPSGSIPPIESVLYAIQGSTTVIQTGSMNDKCQDGSILVLKFAGEDFVVCARQSWLQHDGFQIFGKHLDITVRYETTAPAIVAPRVPMAMLASCGKIPFGDRITSSLSSMLHLSVTEWTHRALRAEGFFDNIWDLVSDDSCRCKGAQRVCVFVAGLSSHDDYGLTPHDPENYFGSEIKDHSPCCSSRQFITLATKKNSWNDPAFQQRLVALLVQASPTSDPATGTIRDTIYFGHSMGNLILAGAIASGKAIIDPSSTWVAASAPMEGSMGSNYIQEWCSRDHHAVVDTIIDLLGGCPTNAGELSLAYKGSTFSSQSLNDAYAAAQSAYATNVSAVMCSNSFMGLVTVKSAVYALAGKVLPHHSPENDGIVEYSSCAMGLSLDSFDNSYESMRYRSGLNHVDTSFRNGDGVFGDKKKPLKWFECLL